jgi:hypothetical protein
MGVKHVEAYGDSLLVVHQVSKVCQSLLDTEISLCVSPFPIGICKNTQGNSLFPVGSKQTHREIENTGKFTIFLWVG